MYRLDSWNEKQSHDFCGLSELNETLFNEYSRYSYIGGIRLLHADHTESDDYEIEWDENELKVAASVKFRFFDVVAMENNGVDPLFIADAYDGDVLAGMEAVLNSPLMNEFDERISEDKRFRDPTDVYIERLYVYPEYRNEGIASMIMENLRNILKVKFNVEPRFIFTVPCPQEPGENGCMENTNDDKMLKLMIKFIESNGFQKLGDSNYYGRNFLLDDIEEDDY